jgi:hypothetical protein
MVYNNRGTENYYLHFPDVDPAYFDIIIDWLYDKKLRSIYPTSTPPTSSSPESSSTSRYLAWDPLTLYLLGKRFKLQVLCDQLMDAWFNVVKTTRLNGTAEDCDRVYRLTPMDSPPRRLMARCAALIFENQHGLNNATSSQWTKEESNALIRKHSDLVDDITAVLEFYPYQPHEDFWKLPVCYFHGHLMIQECKSAERDEAYKKWLKGGDVERLKTRG